MGLNDMAVVRIHTDGACKGNPGPGGWAAVLEYDGRERELSGGEKMTTNNRMELLAAIRALEALKRPCQVELITDSQYVKQGITSWMANWKRRAWRTADGSEVKNRDLWEALDRQAQRHQVQWFWVRGHSGNAGNERVDRLANQAIDELLGAGGS